MFTTCQICKKQPGLQKGKVGNVNQRWVSENTVFIKRNGEAIDMDSLTIDNWNENDIGGLFHKDCFENQRKVSKTNKANKELSQPSITNRPEVEQKASDQAPGKSNLWWILNWIDFYCFCSLKGKQKVNMDNIV